MESTTNVKSTSIFGKVMMVVLTIIGFVIIYFIYKFLYGASSSGGTSIITKQVPANIAQTNLPAITGLYEGGDYAVSMWIYVTSYNINRNKRKHVLEIGGANFSTLLVALGAFKNTLMIRTQSKDSSTVTVGTATNTTAAASRVPTEAFQNATPGSSDATRADGSLSTADLNALFAPLAMDDSLLNPTQPCDISTFDMQRWVNVTVVLSGRTIDVYMDGKLARSCVTNSYYKVDPTGVSLKIAERGGFDGYINGVSAFNYPLSPADVYRIYQAGPTGTSGSAGSMVASLFGIGK